MALRLSPRIYRQNFKWSVLPSNKIDTVTAKPVLNTPLEDKISYIQEVTNVDVGGTAHTLPVGLNVPISHFGASNNYESGQPTTMCIGQVSCVVATGSVTFALNNPLPVMPSAKIHCEGITHFIDRGSLTHDIVNDVSMQDVNSVASWIHSHASGSESWTDKSIDSSNRGTFEDPTLVDYTGQFVPLYAWARKLRTAGEFTLSSDAESRNQPTEQDVLTTWVDQSMSSHWALTKNWVGYGAADAVQMWPVTIYATGDIQSTKLSVRNRTVPITAKVIKIDDYTYRVDYSVPVRYEYLASSQYYTSIFGIRTYHDLDNYCFLDRVNKLKIELVAQELNEETEDISYSLVDGFLSKQVINEHPMSFVQNELITSETFWGANKSNPWTLVMPNYILKKFKDGKYIVECEVPASWALRNDVHINSEFEIQLQDGTMISRNDAVSLFEVKNIEKRFRNDSFIFILRLMEV